jgi:2,4-diaminopentanoate dehydrogenase
MTYKVVQWGTGNFGKLAVQCILKHPDLELIGTWVSSTDKAWGSGPEGPCRVHP